jgi:CheY-like chemotaxis protein
LVLIRAQSAGRLIQISAWLEMSCQLNSGWHRGHRFMPRSSLGRSAVVASDSVGTVAIIDDDAAVLDSLRFLLEVSGYLVATYRSAAEYLAGDGRAVDCMIVDQHMPQMTGLELIARLNAGAMRRNIILITGSSSHAIRERAAELGVAKVLEKPPGDNELLDFVNACARPLVGRGDINWRVPQ